MSGVLVNVFLLSLLVVVSHSAKKPDVISFVRDLDHVWPPKPRQCAEGEVWKECVSGSCSEPTCLKPVVGPACTEDCNYGCYCKDGFFRNAKNVCVTKEKCP